VAITVKLLDLGPLAKFITAKDLKESAEDLLARQRNRITFGLGQSGKPMKPLSPGYAKEVGHATRRLELTGAMLNSRKVTSATETSATIGFENAPKHAFVHQAKTPFVKATPKEREALTDLVRKKVEARLKKNCDEVRRRSKF
jgi:hypothetical protein